MLGDGEDHEQKSPTLTSETGEVMTQREATSIPQRFLPGVLSVRELTVPERPLGYLLQMPADSQTPFLGLRLYVRDRKQGGLAHWDASVTPCWKDEAGEATRV